MILTTQLKIDIVIFIAIFVVVPIVIYLYVKKIYPKDERDF